MTNSARKKSKSFGNLPRCRTILLAAVVAAASQRHYLVTGRTQLREPQARDEVGKAERLQEARCELLFDRLVGLDTAVNPAVCDHLLAVYSRLDRLHAGNRATIRSRAFPNLRRNGVDPSQGYKVLMASGIPDHEVTWLGTLWHLPVVHRATRSDPGFQFGDVLRVAIHLKYVNFNHGAIQVQMPACRDAISPKDASGRYGRATNDYRGNSGLAVERTVRDGRSARRAAVPQPAIRRRYGVLSGRMILLARSAPDRPPRTVGLPRWVSLRI